MAGLEHTTLAEVNFESTSDGTRAVVEESTATMERMTLSTAKEESSCSGAGASLGCASLPSDPAHSSSEYFSARIQSIVDSKSEFETALDAEIEASKGHWSELPLGSGAQGCAEADMELFRRLQEQYATPDGEHSFFSDWDEDECEVGEKIAEGGQGAIHELKWLRPEGADWNGKLVVKVFKLEGWSLEALHQQWPPAMLHKILITSHDPEKRVYGGDGIAPVGKGVMLKDGRFGFVMGRFWGDLRTMIDRRMVHNGNQAPPFSIKGSLWILHDIAKGMLQLHTDGILHRDLKASNVLILPMMWKFEERGAYGKYDSINDDEFLVCIADYECSAVVCGTKFWRAPKILLGVKNRDLQPNSWTKKSDVYSYGMTCYEVLTGKIPLENLRPNDYNVVIEGLRPVIPNDISSSIQSLLARCWHQNPVERPSFEEILKELEKNNELF
ncbi:hypothetical protein M758_11G039800 [Ceratodon purpureus]|nr:hypothetical protein M758_11G039800 [Ceratodon purpureus]